VSERKEGKRRSFASASQISQPHLKWEMMQKVSEEAHCDISASSVTISSERSEREPAEMLLRFRFLPSLSLASESSIPPPPPFENGD